MGIKVSYRSKTKQRMAEIEAQLDALRKQVRNHLMDVNMHGHTDYFKGEAQK